MKTKWILAAFMAAAMSMATTASAVVKQSTAKVTRLIGTASYVDKHGSVHPVALGSQIEAGSTVKTGLGSRLDLDLGKNGPGVALDPDTVLKLDTLSYEDTLLGPVITTEMEVKTGAILGKVKKVTAGSRYDVKTSKGVAHVRGTIFYISGNGDLHVTSGLVSVTVWIMLGGSEMATTTVDVGAGQSLIVGSKVMTAADVGTLAATATPASVAANLGIGNPFFTEYGSELNPVSVHLKYSTTARRDGKFKAGKVQEVVISEGAVE